MGHFLFCFEFGAFPEYSETHVVGALLSQCPDYTDSPEASWWSHIADLYSTAHNYYETALPVILLYISLFHTFQPAMTFREPFACKYHVCAIVHVTSWGERRADGWLR